MVNEFDQSFEEYDSSRECLTDSKRYFSDLSSKLFLRASVIDNLKVKSDADTFGILPIEQISKNADKNIKALFFSNGKIIKTPIYNINLI